MSSSARKTSGGASVRGSQNRGGSTGTGIAATSGSAMHNGGMTNSTHAGELSGLTLKVMLIGDTGVGKTCLLVRFCSSTFLAGSFISTVGIDFRNKVVEVDKTNVKLQIWDTAGQERFRSITRAYYRDAQALLLLYDITNEQTFTNVRVWLQEISEYAQDDVVVVLLGNKADLSPERVVRAEDGEKLAKEHGVAFMETSSKTGLNVDLAFMAIARNLKHRKAAPSAADSSGGGAAFNMAEYVNTKKQRDSCCGS